jgi:lipopolysaccharide export system permease protein
MKRLNWLILTSYIGPMVMSFMIILFILVLQFLSMYIDEIAGKGISLEVIGKLFLYASGKLSLLALPVAILSAALMTYGSLGEHNELAALKSSGIGLFKIARPMIVFGLFLTGVSFWFSFDVVPKANLKFFSLLYDVGKKKAELSLRPGQFYSDIDGYVIRISDKDVESRTLYDILIYNHSENRGAVDVITADSARTRSNQGDPSSMRMVLYSGVRHEDFKEDAGKKPEYNYGRTYFDSLEYRFKLKGFELDRTDEGLFARHQVTLPRNQLADALDSLIERQSRNIVKFRNYLRPYTRVDSSFLPGYQKPEPVSADTTPPKPAPSDGKQLNSVASKLAGLDAQDSLQAIAQALKKRKKKKAEMEETPILSDSLPAKELVPLAWPDSPMQYTALSLFPKVDRVASINKALSACRAVKNYAEFTDRKKKEEAKRQRRYIYEFQLRHSTPLNCLFFMMIGISLGAIIRKGGLGIPALISVALLVIAYVLNAQGKKLAKEGIFDPIFGAWLPVIVFAPLALFLTYKAATEAKILDETIWAKVGERILLGPLVFLKRLERK